MGAEELRVRIKKILQQGGYSQKQLARAMDLHPTLLSNKLAGIRKGRLTYPEVKQIVKTLAEWELIFTRQEVLQMLAELDLTAQLFNAEEWASPPLSKLSDYTAVPVTPLPQAASTTSPGTNQSAPSQNVSTPGSSLKVTRLPQNPTRLIGRDNLLVEISDLLLQENVHLLTLTGPGGIGKTRLAQAVAQRVQAGNHFKDGVHYIPLDNLTNSELVGKAIADGLGLSEKKDNTPPVDQIIEFVGGQEMLFVLDNFEQLIEAAPLLEHLLEYASNLKLLVTSRVTLELYVEWVYPVPPLPLPEIPLAAEGTIADNPVPEGQLETILKNPSVALFVERAKAANLHFKLNEQNLATVVEICQVLDGLPLAIELTAARTRLFDLSTLSEMLQQSYMAVLKIDVRPDKWRAERHRSLQVCLDWSYSLLEPTEQELFYRVGLFADGFNIETASAIQPEDFTKEGLYQGLDSLLSKSLLQVSEEIPGTNPVGAPRRYRMLEPLREYGLEQLKQTAFKAGQDLLPVQESCEHKIWRQYCHYWAGWVKGEVEQLYGPEVQASYRRIQIEYSNILAALEWGLQHEARLEVLELASELAFFWIWGTRYTEGSRYLDRVIGLCYNPRPTDPTELSLLGKVLYGAGFIAVNQIDFKKAEWELKESQTIFKNLGDKVWLARVLSGLSFRATSQGEFKAGRVFLDESLAISREIGNENRVAAALNNLGVVAIHLQENEAAWDYCQECLSLCRKHENQPGQAMTLNLLGYLATIRQDFQQAFDNLEESQEISRALGNKETLNLTQNVLALYYYGQANFEEAARKLNEGLRIASEIGDRFGVLYNLSAQPAIAIKLSGPANLEKLAWAARLLGATSALLTRTSGFALPRFRELFEESITTIRAELPHAIFENEWDSGKIMTLEEAVGMVWQPGSPSGPPKMLKGQPEET